MQEFLLHRFFISGGIVLGASKLSGMSVPEHITDYNVAMINRAIRMDGTESRELARKVRDRGLYNNEAELGKLYTQMSRDGGDVGFVSGVANAGEQASDEYNITDIGITDVRDDFENVTIRGTTKIKQGIAAFPQNDVLCDRIKLVEPDGEKFDVALHGSPTSVGFGSRQANMSPIFWLR